MSFACASALGVWAVFGPAIATTDPRIYALAFRTCRGAKEDGCYAIDARRWAELDAGDALPWVFLMTGAAGAGMTKRIAGDSTRAAAINTELAQWVAEFSPPRTANCDTVRNQLNFLSRVAAAGPQAALREKVGGSAAR